MRHDYSCRLPENIIILFYWTAPRGTLFIIIIFYSMLHYQACAVNYHYSCDSYYNEALLEIRQYYRKHSTDYRRSCVSR